MQVHQLHQICWTASSATVRNNKMENEVFFAFYGPRYSLNRFSVCNKRCVEFLLSWHQQGARSPAVEPGQQTVMILLSFGSDPLVQWGSRKLTGSSRAQWMGWGVWFDHITSKHLGSHSGSLSNLYTCKCLLKTNTFWRKYTFFPSRKWQDNFKNTDGNQSVSILTALALRSSQVLSLWCNIILSRLYKSWRYRINLYILYICIPAYLR